MTPTRSLLTAAVAAAVLIGASPIAGDDQFPRGLMSAAPRGGGGGSCRIETRPVSFGNYDPLEESAVTAIGQVIYICGEGGNGGGPPDGRGGGPPPGRGGGPGSRTSQNQGIRIEMDRGTGSSNQEREMVGGPHFDVLRYDLYLDATYQTVWGDGSNGTDVYVDLNPPLGRPVVVPVYGRIFGRQDVPAGQYGDQVQVRIVF
jgi:spore coat protein U-like protein